MSCLKRETPLQSAYVYMKDICTCAKLIILPLPTPAHLDCKVDFFYPALYTIYQTVVTVLIYMPLAFASYLILCSDIASCNA